MICGVSVGTDFFCLFNNLQIVFLSELLTGRGKGLYVFNLIIFLYYYL